MTRKNANRTDPISMVMLDILYDQIGLCMLFNFQLEWNNHYFLRDTGRICAEVARRRWAAPNLRAGQLCSAVPQWSTPNSLHTVVDESIPKLFYMI